MPDHAIRWDMSDSTIVRKVGADGHQETFAPPSFERVKEGERMNFDAHVVVQSLPAGKHLKKATIFSNVPNGGTWEIISDEGTAVGGRGTAPSPLMYFAVGIGLCFMSHVEMLAKQKGIVFERAILEQKTSFSTTLDLGGVDPKNVFGKGEKVVINLIIASDAKTAQLEEFTGYVGQACMALQTVADATPVETNLILNGTPIRIRA